MANIKNGGINYVTNYLNGALPYIGIGTGVDTGASDAVLQNELLRRASTGFIDGNIVVRELFLDENSGNDIDFTNIGVFQNDASQTIGTGTLFSGDNITFRKNDTQSITLSFEITVKEV